MKPTSTIEALHDFANYAKKHDIFVQQSKVVSLIAGPIFNSREKLQNITSYEADKLLRDLEYSHAMDGVKASILEVFDEEVAKAISLLKEAQLSINQLKGCLDAVTTCMERDLKAGENISRAVSECVENCRSVAVHFQLRNKILKHYLMAPPELKLSSDPFSQVPEFKEEDERIVYFLCKIEAVKY